MKITFLRLFTLFIVSFSCNGNSDRKQNDAEIESVKEISCKLTAPELMERKQTVLASLRKEVLEKKELPDGYSFRFNGSDSIYSQLTDFIKSERLCCDFFTFTLKISAATSSIWMEITGPEGTKDFIKGEMQL